LFYTIYAAGTFKYTDTGAAESANDGLGTAPGPCSRKLFATALKAMLFSGF
jgi:hypothetical protein